MIQRAEIGSYQNIGVQGTKYGTSSAEIRVDSLVDGFLCRGIFGVHLIADIHAEVGTFFYARLIFSSSQCDDWKSSAFFQHLRMRIFQRKHGDFHDVIMLFIVSLCLLSRNEHYGL